MYLWKCLSIGTYVCLFPPSDLLLLPVSTGIPSWWVMMTACPAWTVKRATLLHPPALCACWQTSVGSHPLAGDHPSDRNPIGATPGVDDAPTGAMRTCNRYWSCHDKSMKHREDLMQVGRTHGCVVSFLLYSCPSCPVLLFFLAPPVLLPALLPCSPCPAPHANPNSTHSDIELAKALSQLENPGTERLSPLVPLPSLSSPSPPDNTRNAGLTWLHHPLEGATPHSPDNDLSWLPERGEFALPC